MYRRLECTTIATFTRRRILLASGSRMPSVRLLVPFTQQHIYRASHAARMKMLVWQVTRTWNSVTHHEWRRSRYEQFILQKHPAASMRSQTFSVESRENWENI
jgi:hypothetical protein